MLAPQSSTTAPGRSGRKGAWEYSSRRKISSTKNGVSSAFNCSTLSSIIVESVAAAGTKSAGEEGDVDAPSLVQSAEGAGSMHEKRAAARGASCPSTTAALEAMAISPKEAPPLLDAISPSRESMCEATAVSCWCADSACVVDSSSCVTAATVLGVGPIPSTASVAAKYSTTTRQMLVAADHAMWLVSAPKLHERSITGVV